MNYNEIFPPVLRHTSIHVLLVLIATKEMKLKQLNEKTTFLHGKLEEEIFMKQPKGFEVQGKEDSAYRLKRSLYGLKQSLR